MQPVLAAFLVPMILLVSINVRLLAQVVDQNAVRFCREAGHLIDQVPMAQHDTGEDPPLKSFVDMPRGTEPAEFSCISPRSSSAQSTDDKE